MFSSFTHHKARWLTGIALASVVGLIGWIDSLILTWAVLGLISLFAFHEAMQLFRIASQSAYFWAAALWVLAYFYPNPDDLFFLTAVVFGSALA
ncbi:MAG TPA: phosphatidate cytidylyltransferase, partial [Epsilonproteobacteria bacterium]|nr:phosphatidate cytidylyltransferase [Campylobacterota bacterium]